MPIELIILNFLVVVSVPIIYLDSKYTGSQFITIGITKILYLKAYPILLSFSLVIYGLSTFSIDYNAPIPILLIRYTTARYYNRKKICVKRNSTE